MSSWIWLRMAFVRTDVSEKNVASIIMVTRTEVFIHSLLLLLVTANVARSSPILLTLIMEAVFSSITSVPTRTTRSHIPEDGILHSHLRENLKSYIALTSWTLTETWSVSCEERTGILHPIRRLVIAAVVKTSVLHSITRLGSVTGCNVFLVRYELGFYIP
jgi:hypothetical protein